MSEDRFESIGEFCRALATCCAQESGEDDEVTHFEFLCFVLIEERVIGLEHIEQHV